MKYSFIFLLLLPTSLLAEVLRNCGEYEARGVVRQVKNDLILVVNEKSLSEEKIHFPFLEQNKMSSYRERSVKARFTLAKRSEGKTLLEISDRVPNPLKPQDTGFVLLKKMDCL